MIRKICFQNEQIKDNFKLLKIDIKDQFSDFLTNALCYEKLEFCLNNINVRFVFFEHLFSLLITTV